MAGGHLARMEEEQRNAMLESIIAMVLGAGAMATGAPGAGQAVMAGGAQVAQRQMLMNSREHEAAADQAGVTFLDRTGQSSRGLRDFLNILEERERGAVGRKDEFLLDHPLTPDRVEFVRNHVENSKFSDVPEPAEYDEQFQRIQAKLMGFLRTQQETFTRYPESDTSLPARYARAIAYYRVPDLGHALPLIDGLLAERPTDPYFYELKGQMLFENGRVKDALAPYQRAVELKPDNALLKIELAQVELESGDATLVPKAMTLLNNAAAFEGDNADLWRLLAVAYGRNGNMGMMALSLAEQGMADGKYADARQQAARAIKLLPPGAQRQRAQDIADDARRERARQD
jgi:predicted Zn-dependent protease